MEAKVQVETPLASVPLQGLGFVLVVPVSVALKVGVTLGQIGLLFASFKVIVMIDVDIPLAMTGPDPTIVE